MAIDVSARKPRIASTATLSAAIVFGLSLANLISLSDCKSINSSDQASQHNGLGPTASEPTSARVPLVGGTNPSLQDSQWIPIKRSVAVDASQQVRRSIVLQDVMKPSESKSSRVLADGGSAPVRQSSTSGCHKRASNATQTKSYATVAATTVTSPELVASEESDQEDDGDNQFDQEDEREEQAELLANSNKTTTPGLKPIIDHGNGTDSIQGSDSVSLESSMIPPPIDDGDGGSAQYSRGSSSTLNDDDDQQAEDAGQPTNPAQSYSAHDDNDNEGNQSDESDSDSDSSKSGQSRAALDDEAKVRKEQEAAEASEAEAADRSALDEQQQAQREIILAQAQSEAKAIKEQQEALLRQQQLQQQMLLRRHQSDLNHHDNLQNGKRGANSDQGSLANRGRTKKYHTDGSNRNFHHTAESSSSSRKRTNQNLSPRKVSKFHEPASYKQNHLAATASTNTRQQQRAVFNRAQMDIQFSDHPDHLVDNGSESERHPDETMSSADSGLKNVNVYGGSNDYNQNALGSPKSQRSTEDELGGEYSTRRTQHTSSPVASIPKLSPVDLDSAPTDLKFNLTDSDLIAAAQHQFGAHFDSLQGHHSVGGGSHGDYYQFAESKKKGQFDSGFKRGDKKFNTSGHSSQHKGQAEGHVKWSAKKGKGSHYWDLKHKNKKHYGMGGGYGGGHSFY